MTRKNNTVFIACDTHSEAKVKKIIELTKNSPLNIGYKFGLEFFNSKHGRNFISKLPKQHMVWLDLKLKDIPNTVASSIHSLKDLTNINYLTIHASGGIQMMQAAKLAVKKTNKKLKILAVTVLTSFSEKSIKQIQYFRYRINFYWTYFYTSMCYYINFNYCHQWGKFQLLTLKTLTLH